MQISKNTDVDLELANRGWILRNMIENKKQKTFEFLEEIVTRYVNINHYASEDLVWHVEHDREKLYFLREYYNIKNRLSEHIWILKTGKISEVRSMEEKISS